MRLRLTFQVLSTVAAMWLAMATAAAQRAPGAEMKWLCGGVGAEERQSLVQQSKGSTLELRFATARRGGYLADVQFKVFASSGKLPLIAAKAEGPFCYLWAPPGRYRIEAEHEGNRRNATVRVTKGKSATWAVIRFPDEPWDGVSASDEEKRQAKQP